MNIRMKNRFGCLGETLQKQERFNNYSNSLSSLYMQIVFIQKKSSRK